MRHAANGLILIFLYPLEVYVTRVRRETMNGVRGTILHGAHTSAGDLFSSKGIKRSSKTSFEGERPINSRARHEIGVSEIRRLPTS